jgi:hypothetical protein
MRFLPTLLHGMLDYLVGLLLIASPWLLDFEHGGAESWVPVILGAVVILYSALTDYDLGLVRSIGMPTHLAFDTAGGLVLALSPWLFGFAYVVIWPHVIVGIFEILVASVTRTMAGDRRPLMR